MPRYDLPFKEATEARPMDAMASRQRVFLPIDQEILDTLALDKEVVVTLRGVVTDLNSIHPEESQTDFGLWVKVIEVAPRDNEYGELADDMDEDEEY